MKIYRNSNGKINIRLRLTKKVSFKLFYQNCKRDIYPFKYLYSSYNRFENGNATFFIYILGLNLSMYINKLKENKRTFLEIIKY
jgi:hypothetical protein